MNKSVSDISGELLLVPQFTLAASTDKGLRPSFSKAASPEKANHLFSLFTEKAKHNCPLRIACGQFGQNMQVGLINDGPATFILASV